MIFSIDMYITSCIVDVRKKHKLSSVRMNLHICQVNLLLSDQFLDETVEFIGGSQAILAPTLPDCLLAHLISKVSQDITISDHPRMICSIDYPIFSTEVCQLQLLVRYLLMAEPGELASPNFSPFLQSLPDSSTLFYKECPHCQHH